MQYKLIKWNASNYEIILNVDETTINSLKENVVKHFQANMDLPWFRKWHVPLDIVMKNISPEYFTIWIYEEAIHQWLNKVMTENPTIQFIGQVYDLQNNDKDGKLELSFKLDTFPEVEVLNQNWETLSISSIDDNPSEEEINQTLENLKRQYAEYADIDTVSENTVTKIRFDFKDKDWNNIDKGSSMIGPEDYAEFAIMKTLFIGKKKEETFEIDYKKEDLPVFLQYTKELKATKMSFQILDIKEVKLPEMNDENIKKFFWSEVNGIDDLKAKIKDLISAEKRKTLLTKEVEELLTKLSSSLSIFMPKTMIDEEVKVRMESLEKRVWGKQGLEDYFTKIWEEGKTKMIEEIKTSAKISLEKFFMLRKLTELLKIENIDWNKPFDAEEKIYEKLAWTQSEEKETKKAKTPKSK